MGKLVEFVDASGKIVFFDPHAVVCIDLPEVYAEIPDTTWFKVVFSNSVITLEGDRDEFVRLVQKRRGV